MIGWIFFGVTYLLAFVMFWLEETDGSLTNMDLQNWFFGIIWPITMFWALLCAVFRKLVEWYACRKAYKRGYKDGYAGKPRVVGIYYLARYCDGYDCGREKANQDTCSLG